jgi:AcrR family transcriptional regulator
MKSNRRTQAERSASTRDALVAAARPLFGARGYGDVGIEEIVRAAGITRGALYHHFADKTDLFAAVFEAVETEVTARIVAGLADADQSDLVAVMRQGARVFLDACAETEIHRIMLLDAPAVLGFERWREISNRHNTGLVHDLLNRAIEAGQIPEQPVPLLAHTLLGALREAALYLGGATNRRKARREAGAIIDRLITGLTAD